MIEEDVELPLTIVKLADGFGKIERRDVRVREIVGAPAALDALRALLRATDGRSHEENRLWGAPLRPGDVPRGRVRLRGWVG